jgi:hypothetical protein
MRKARFGHGIDPLQSLMLAIEGARVTLRARKPDLTWADGESGDVGISPLIPMYFGHAFARRIERLIEREADRFTKGRARRATRRR